MDNLIKLRYVYATEDGYDFDYHNLLEIEKTDWRGYKDGIIPVHRNLFTGFKDKNGKEIYQGDIVRVNEPFSNNLEVSWFEGGFSLTYRNYSRHFIDVTKMEVIGNIYENLELIK